MTEDGVEVLMSRLKRVWDVEEGVARKHLRREGGAHLHMPLGQNIDLLMHTLKKWINDG